MAVTVQNYYGDRDVYFDAGGFNVGSDGDLRVFEDGEMVAFYPRGSFHRAVYSDNTKKEN